MATMTDQFFFRILSRIKNFIRARPFSLLMSAYHFLLSFLAALIYGFPSRRLFVVGVTGTKGKTTVVELLHEMLSRGGSRVASLSSLRFRIGEKSEKNDRKMTMPGRFFVQRFLRRAVRAGCRWAVIEVTSEGILQFRHRFIRFRAAVMTNIAPEHIEAHGGFEPYLRAKLDLFWRLPKDGVAILNRQDSLSLRFAAATQAKKAWYGKEEIILGGKSYRVAHAAADREGVSFEINTTPFHSFLFGEFGIMNILAASSLALSQHIPLEEIAFAVGRVKGIPGRMEVIQQSPFVVVVDYAHTPESLREVYRSMKNFFLAPSGRLLCILGAAGGGRDRWKRPEFGRIAMEHCDTIILANEDPYDENPSHILDDIASGFSRYVHPSLPPRDCRKILDRKRAIRTAVKLAREGDALIITGKGAEPWIMGPEGKRIPWDDREVLRKALGIRPAVRHYESL
jgi:UDP-N-acetylmuramoyl-L-alanyl-D-glutamate--2,6-diaminopimelate ligase